MESSTWNFERIKCILILESIFQASLVRCACAWETVIPAEGKVTPPLRGHSRLPRINGRLSLRPGGLSSPLSGTAAHSCGCSLALISASLMSWEVPAGSLFAPELLGDKVTALCAPGLSLTSCIRGSSDLCFQAPGTGVLAGASSKGPAGSPLHPAPPAGPQGGWCPGASAETRGFSSSQSFTKRPALPPVF